MVFFFPQVKHFDLCLIWTLIFYDNVWYRSMKRVYALCSLIETRANLFSSRKKWKGKTNRRWIFLAFFKTKKLKQQKYKIRNTCPSLQKIEHQKFVVTKELPRGPVAHQNYFCWGVRVNSAPWAPSCSTAPRLGVYSTFSMWNDSLLFRSHVTTVHSYAELQAGEWRNRIDLRFVLCLHGGMTSFSLRIYVNSLYSAAEIKE